MSESFHTFLTTPCIPPLTCFFFRASSVVFWEAFRAAGLKTVFVRPMEVENTYKGEHFLHNLEEREKDRNTTRSPIFEHCTAW